MTTLSCASARFAFCLAVLCACSDDDRPAEPDDDRDAALPDAGADDAGSDASTRGDTRPDPNAPPETLDGKKLYTVRFDSRAGNAPFACGQKVTLGTKGTLAEPVDMRFFVHDVSLVRANGERVKLDLFQDERFQRENVALLDFVDDTGGCLTGDADIRNVVHGYAPEASDYSAVAFKVGVPADKNHLDGAQAPAPYNASGMWWSWAGGYKYMRLELTSEPQPIWYFHGGATNCSGNVAGGFDCEARQIAEIELPNYDPAASLVVFDAERFYANADISVAEGTPGCMGFPGEGACLPLYNTLGLQPWDDAAEAPEQTAFVLTTGRQLVQSRGTTSPDRAIDDPTAWPDPTYERPPAFDIENISNAGATKSHPATDPRWGINCMRCHQEFGPGFGKFSVAGTVVDTMGRPASFAKVELFSAATVGYGQFENVVSQAVLDVDANGNFFTTEPLPAGLEFSANILGADGETLLTMPFTQPTAACNNCHTAGFRLTVPAP